MVAAQRRIKSLLSAVHVFAAAFGGVDAEEEDAELELLRATLDFVTPPLTMPATTYVQADFAEESFWAAIRVGGREAAYLRFLGVPRFLFDELAERMRGVLPASYDRAVNAPGRPFTFDYIDMTAIALRRLRIGSSKALEIACAEFARNKSTMSRALETSAGALLAVLRASPSAAVRYPTRAEAVQMIKGKEAQLGDDGLDGIGVKTIIFGDGTVTPSTKDPNDEKQKLNKSGNKGHAWNHILFFDVGGCIVDYSIANVGALNDERASAAMIARHQNVAVNPLRLGLVLDSGWKTAATFTDGSDGRAQVTRPITEADKKSLRRRLPRAVRKVYLKAYSIASRNLVVFRQSNEHGNGGIKRAFPILQRAVAYDRKETLERDVELCIRLWNCRTRLVGWNQVNTTFMRHADQEVKALLQKRGSVAELVALRRRRFVALLARGAV